MEATLTIDVAALLADVLIADDLHASMSLACSLLRVASCLYWIDNYFF